MIKERFISKFSLLMDVRNLAFGARHIKFNKFSAKTRAILCVFRSLDDKFSFCHVGTINLITTKAG